MNKVLSYTKLARPSHYLKNAFVFSALFFGYKLNDPVALAKTVWAFIAFSLAASSVYIFNDLHDLEADQEHPVKKFRPLAAGDVSKREASLLLLFFLIISSSISLTVLGGPFFLVLGLYILLNVAYSIGLKHFAVVDITCIAVGFVLRVFAGGVATDIPVSHWLILMTFLLALFLALAKRRDDLLLSGYGHNTRKSLDGYNRQFVSLSMIIMAAVVIVSYILYTVSPEVISKYRTDKLYLTAFWVIVGLLRYMQITFVQEKSGSPTLAVFRDIFLQIVLLSWIGSFYLVIYIFGH